MLPGIPNHYASHNSRRLFFTPHLFLKGAGFTQLKLESIAWYGVGTSLNSIYSAYDQRHY